MNNKEIARKFSLLGKLMELHEESPFKYKSYNNAYLNIRKLPRPLSDMSTDELQSVPGIGKAITAKIKELLDTGRMQTLDRYIDVTPVGIIEMLGIKGFGPKKINLIWKTLEIDTIGELLNAIKEDKLTQVKGFGQKTQESLREQLEYHLESRNSHLYANIEKTATTLIKSLTDAFQDHKSALSGPIARKCQIVNQIDLTTTIEESSLKEYLLAKEDISVLDEIYYLGQYKLHVQHSGLDEFEYSQVKNTLSDQLWQELSIPEGNYKSETEVFQSIGLPDIIPEMREIENLSIIKSSTEKSQQKVIHNDDIKGCLHNHSTYSDGVNTLVEMVEACIAKGFEYFMISDHSQSAFYANGLSEERLIEQINVIRELDQSYDDIRIFSGIESDILNDGRLDYPDELLGQLDIVIASVHSNLKMDSDKATNRILRAIENPFTSILGHPTGRLLLSRKGYPLDHKMIIDACADNNVAIELNANPHRLDLDWRYIDYAMEKDVLISINPDAHSIAGIDDIKYGINVARKGGLSRYNCLNAFDIEDFEDWMQEQHLKRG